MNVQELIESGKLELYVAGVLNGNEARQIATMVKAERMLQREVRSIEQVMISVLQANIGMPRPELKDRVMAAIHHPPLQVAINHGLEATDKVKSRVVRMSAMSTWLAAASVALLVALGFTYYTLSNRIGIQQAEIAAVKEKYETSASAGAKLADELALINHQNTKKILLNGVALSPASKAIVYWNNLNGRVMISALALPAPPTGKQYQLWALWNGKPVDAGVFDTNADATSLQELKVIAHAQAFAVTLEERGGVLAPTLSAMYAMGNI